jgi:pilus assembly protein CpaF
VMQEIFKFEQHGVDASGRVLGDFHTTGIRPRVMERIERAGVDLEKLTVLAG